MFSGKKISISLLATLVAVPNLAFGAPTKVTKTTTKTTTTTAGSKGSGGLLTPGFKKDLEMIGIAAGVGGVAALVARVKLYNLYKSLGGPQDMKTFFNKADLRAKQLIQKTDAANKVKSKLAYEPLTEDQKDALTQEAFEGYFTDNSAKLFGLQPDQFKSWFDSLGGTGANLDAKADTADLVIRQLTLNSDLAIPGAKAGELPFQSAVRYAVTKQVTTRGQASDALETFSQRLTPDTSGSTASGIGRAARGAVDVAGEAASDAARGIANAGKSIASGVRSVPDYAGQVGRGYVTADQSGNLYSELQGPSRAANTSDADRLASAPQASVQYEQQLRAGMASAQAAQAADTDMANKYAEAGQARTQTGVDETGEPVYDDAI